MKLMLGNCKEDIPCGQSLCGEVGNKHHATWRPSLGRVGPSWSTSSLRSWPGVKLWPTEGMHLCHFRGNIEWAGKVWDSQACGFWGWFIIRSQPQPLKPDSSRMHNLVIVLTSMDILPVFGLGDRLLCYFSVCAAISIAIFITRKEGRLWFAILIWK